jgi:phosphomannomutase
MASLESPAVARELFGTDGVRGIVGEFVTTDLV